MPTAHSIGPEVHQKNQRFTVLIAAWLGLMFDGFDATIAILVIYPALSELLSTSSHAEIGAAGGILVAALMFGWGAGSIIFGALSDYIGRTRTLAISILLYAVCSGLCALSHNFLELLLLRFLVGCGIGGEQSTGAVMMAEAWKGKARLHATGLMTTAFGAGYIFAGLINLWLGHYGWRILFLSGVLPAILTFFIRFKLEDPPELIKQREKNRKEANSAKLHLFASLTEPEQLRKVLVVSALASTAIIGYWGVAAWLPPWINQLTGTAAIEERSIATFAMNVGAVFSGIITGSLMIAVGKPNCFRIAFLGSLISFLGMFWTVDSFGTGLLAWAFLGGFFSQLPFQCVFIYAPELFKASIRGGAVGFSVQTGRIVGALFCIFSGQLVALFGGSYQLAGSTIALIYLFGCLVTFFMPATNGEVSLLEDEENEESEKEAVKPLPATFLQ